MKKHFSLALILMLIFPLCVVAQELEVTNIAKGSIYSSSAYDSDGNLWIGTYREGLYKSVQNREGVVEGISLYYDAFPFQNVSINSIITPVTNGKPTVMVGTSRHDRGGVYEFDPNIQSEPSLYIAERDPILSAGMGISSAKNDGLPSRACNALAVSDWGHIWSAHGFHTHMHLSSTSYQMFNPFTFHFFFETSRTGAFFAPGGIGYKQANSNKFDNLALKYSDAFPYPAYTISPMAETAQTWHCVSVGAGRNETWVARHSYIEKDNESMVLSGIERFSSAGRYLGRIDADNAGVLPIVNEFGSPLPYSIHFRKRGDVWMGFNLDKGFAVSEDVIRRQDDIEWTYVESLNHYNKETGEQEPSQLLTENITFNLSSHLIAGSGQRVFLGTRQGLLIYKGIGDVRQDSSYTLITTEDGLSSNNIRSISMGGRFVFVTTDAGIDRVFISSDMEVLRVKDASKPLSSIDDNLSVMTSLTSRSQHGAFDDDEMPSFAADSTISIFRYYTDDFEGFYNGDKYNYYLNLLGTRYTDYLELRPVEDYEDDSRKYVDFIFTHPGHIRNTNQHFDQYLLKITENQPVVEKDVFNHRIKVEHPPVLLVHGVWTDRFSMHEVEGHLIEHGGYEPYKLESIYRDDKKLAENTFEGDAHEIPDAIDKLLTRCANNGLSAGKASLVTHSRGGLYARAYIQGLDDRYPYRDDIHSLITLNTPHAGSQLANAVMDDRVFYSFVRATSIYPYHTYQTNLDDIRVDIKVSDVFSLQVPSADQELNNGARGLKIDGEFVARLNEESSMQKMAEHKVPVHAIATTFNACDANYVDCDQIFKPPTEIKDAQGRPIRPTLSRVTLKIDILKMILTDAVPSSADNLLDNIFDGEEHDMIVPYSSMTGGLSSEYTSTLEEHNISHTDLKILGKGVTTSPHSLGRVLELLQQNVREQDESDFTVNGFNPPKGENGLQYNFLPSLGETPALAEKIMGEEEMIFNFDREADYPVVQPGDTLSLPLLSSGIDTLMISVEQNNQDDDLIYLGFYKGLTDTNDISIIVPESYVGNFNVIAYGFSGNDLLAIDTLILNSRGGNELLDIFFDMQTKTIELTPGKSMIPDISGLYADSVYRNMNNVHDLFFFFTNNSIASQDSATYKVTAEQEGETYLVVAYEGVMDSLKIVVRDEKGRTIMNNFFAHVSTEGIVSFNWSTMQEYMCEEFVIEESTDSITFIPLVSVDANGTVYQRSHYNADEPFTYDEKAFYRLKTVVAYDSVPYVSPIIPVLPKTEVVASIEGEQLSLEKSLFELYPNPVQGGDLNVRLSESLHSESGTISLYSISGNVIHTQEFDASNGVDLHVALPEFVAVGVYILEIETPSVKQSKRLLISQ